MVDWGWSVLGGALPPNDILADFDFFVFSMRKPFPQLSVISQPTIGEGFDFLPFFLAVSCSDHVGCLAKMKCSICSYGAPCYTCTWHCC